MAFSVLIVDGDQNFANSFRDALRSESIEAGIEGSAPDAVALVKSRPDIRLVFVDSYFPNAGGIRILEQLHRIDPSLTVLLVCASGCSATAYEAIRNGADDYILKPFDHAVMARKVREFSRLIEGEFACSHATSPSDPIQSLEDFVYCSASMEQVLEQASRASPTEASVLLVGERGVGKDLLARAIHNASPRAQAPFFGIECSSFVHEVPGRAPYRPDMPASALSEDSFQKMVRATAGGTLLLREVGELPEVIQSKLVHNLDRAGLLRPDGDSSEQPGARVLASSSRSAEELRERFLRKDLFSRLAAVVIEIPPLRSRADDVLPLAKYFMRRLSRRYQRQFELSWSGVNFLKHYSFPGNIRELEFVLERVAGYMLQTPRKVTNRDLLPILEEAGIPQPAWIPEKPPVSLDLLEQWAIKRALRLTNGNRRNAAELLGIDRSTLYAKLRKMNGEINGL